MIENLGALAIMVSIVWLWTYCAAIVLTAVGAARNSEFSQTWGAILARCHQEMWLAAAPGIFVVSPVYSFHADGHQWLLVFDALNAWVWWNARNWPDDNLWKRRGRRLAEKVAESAGRLVVVPA